MVKICIIMKLSCVYYVSYVLCIIMTLSCVYLSHVIVPVTQVQCFLQFVSHLCVVPGFHVDRNFDDGVDDKIENDNLGL